MKKTVFVCGVFLAAASAFAQPGPKHVHGRLDGWQEDASAAGSASVSTTGKGEFHGRVSNDGTRFAYELKYSGLEGAITQAHIHLGRHAQTGGIVAFLCSNLGNGPAGTQACPASPATITGVIEADDIIGPSGQGIAAGEFAEFLRALRAAATYVNVHTDKHPSGEIRANLDGPGRGPGDKDDDDDDDD